MSLYSDWNNYLANLSDQKIAVIVSRFWEQAVELCKPKELLIPSAGFCEDGAYQLAWDLDEHHLDIDIDFATIDWFYRNRKTDEIDGNDDIEITDRLVERLKLVSK
jgi:hypothetical protein